jgi:hypothetical protein
MFHSCDNVYAQDYKIMCTIEIWLNDFFSLFPNVYWVYHADRDYSNPTISRGGRTLTAVYQSVTEFWCTFDMNLLYEII